MVDVDFFLSGGLDARGNAQVLSIGNITCQGKTLNTIKPISQIIQSDPFVQMIVKQVWPTISVSDQATLNTFASFDKMV